MCSLKFQDHIHPPIYFISAAPVSESDQDRSEIMREAAAGADRSSDWLENSALYLPSYLRKNTSETTIFSPPKGGDDGDGGDGGGRPSLVDAAYDDVGEEEENEGKGLGTLVVTDLGWVDFDLGSRWSTFLSHCTARSDKFSSAQAEQGRDLN